MQTFVGTWGSGGYLSPTLHNVSTLMTPGEEGACVGLGIRAASYL